MLTNWLKLWSDAALFGLETQRVIGLRMMKMAAGGPAAQREAQRMISEKVAAFAEAGATLAMGAPPTKVARRLRSQVRANGRRLKPRKPRK